MFKELIARLGNSLKSHSIPYMIIGGQAVLLYGEPRLTRDIDITLGVNTDYLKEILRLVQDIPLKVLPEDVYRFVSTTMVLPTLHEDTGIRVDFIFSFTSYEQEAIRRARGISIHGTEVYFASPEDVIIHKVFAGRARDIEDIRSILLKNPEIDTEYIEKWLREFDSIQVEKSGLLETFKKIREDIMS